MCDCLCPGYSKYTCVPWPGWVVFVCVWSLHLFVICALCTYLYFIPNMCSFRFMYPLRCLGTPPIHACLDTDTLQACLPVPLLTVLTPPWLQYNRTALILAAWKGHRHTVLELIKRGAMIDAADEVMPG